MAFENTTNVGRVEKMIDTLRLIQKSAESNRATEAQIRTLLTPLIAALAPYCGTQADRIEDTTEPATPARPVADLTAGDRAALHLANGASLRQLTAALLGRLEAHEARLPARAALE